jgi:hypothetical protein
VLETNFGRFEPTNLDQALKVESLKVIATVRRRNDPATTCGVGRAIVTISRISRAAPNNKTGAMVKRQVVTKPTSIFIPIKASLANRRA